MSTSPSQDSWAPGTYTVDEQQRNRILDAASLVEEVDLQRLEAITLDGSPEVRMLIQ
jgi:hypothetical protein